MNPIVCPMCWHGSACSLKPTKRGTWYWRCMACASVGFINSPGGLNGLTMASRIAEVYGQSQVLAALSQSPTVIDALLRERTLVAASPAVAPAPTQVQEVR